MSAYCPEGTGTCADAEAGPCVLGLPCEYSKKQETRELGLLLENGTLVVGPGWTTISEIHYSFHGFGVTQVYGVIVDVETLAQVYPPSQLMDGTATGKD